MHGSMCRFPRQPQCFLAALLLCSLGAMGAVCPIAPAPGALSLRPLGAGALPHVIVTALAVAGGRTIYAAGRYVTPPPATAVTASPYLTAGSVWLVSRDNGATWADQRISTRDSRAVIPGATPLPWRDHTRLPVDFTAQQIVIDPHNPRVLYVAGCSSTNEVCGFPTAGHMLLRSTDGGKTWADALTFSVSGRGIPTAQTIQTNIAKTPVLLARLAHADSAPVQAFAVAFDPRHANRVYACVNALGTLRSDDGARTWLWVPQAPRLLRGCELVFDPRHDGTIYSLGREGTLYRSTDAGAHWVLRSTFGYHESLSDPLYGHGGMFDLTFVGRALYAAVGQGLARSDDGGAHWRVVAPSPVPLGGGYVVGAVRGQGGWLLAIALNNGTGLVYTAVDGGSWHRALSAVPTGQIGHSVFDAQTMIGSNVTAIWEDHQARIVFTAGVAGGLYRFGSPL